MATEPTITPHPDFESYSSTDLKAAILDLEDKIHFAQAQKLEQEFVVWLIQERRIAQAELSRRNGSQPLSQQAEFWPELLSAQELLQRPQDQTRWIWEDCLPVGSCSLLVAKAKTGKSTFAAALSICIARGWPFLARGIQQGTVAYLSLDASFDEIREVFVKFGIKDSDPIYFQAGQSPRQNLKWCTEKIEKHGVKFLVVDTIQRMFKFKNINDYSEVTNALEPLDQAARELRCHIQYLHHAGKEQRDDLDSAIGSSALRGLAYAFLHLKRLSDSSIRIFRSDQRGGKNFDEISISDGSSGTIEKVGTRQAAEIELYKPRVREFFVEQSERVTEKEMKLAVEGQPRLISQTLRSLEKAGEVNRISMVGGRGRKVGMWGLTQKLFSEEALPERTSLFSVKGVRK